MLIQNRLWTLKALEFPLSSFLPLADAGRLGSSPALVAGPFPKGAANVTMFPACEP